MSTSLSSESLMRTRLWIDSLDETSGFDSSASTSRSTPKKQPNIILQISSIVHSLAKLSIQMEDTTINSEDMQIILGQIQTCKLQLNKMKSILSEKQNNAQNSQSVNQLVQTITNSGHTLAMNQNQPTQYNMSNASNPGGQSNPSGSGPTPTTAMNQNQPTQYN